MDREGKWMDKWMARKHICRGFVLAMDHLKPSPQSRAQRRCPFLGLGWDPCSPHGHIKSQLPNPPGAAKLETPLGHGHLIVRGSATPTPHGISDLPSEPPGPASLSSDLTRTLRSHP